jgi:hypothetical protein
MEARMTMRVFSLALLGSLLGACLGGVNASAETVQLASIPAPLPFPQGTSVYQWDYQCVEHKVCGFSGLGLERLSLQSASIVLATIKAGKVEIPAYFIWGTLRDGSQVYSMVQDPFRFRFSALNMQLVASGSPGL